MPKYIKINVQNKHDLEINWLQVANFIPLQGELIIYDREVDVLGNVLTKVVDGAVVPQLPTDRTEPYRYERFKIGDGIHSVIELPFVTDQYYTKTEVDAAIDNIPEVDLSQHALKSEIPTRVSQLDNDNNFITLAEVPKIDLSDYAKKSEIPTVPTDVSAFNNDVGYLTQHQDLSPYAKKTDIPDVSKFITEVPAEYITESELEAKKYLTEHQSLSDYAKKVELPTSVSQLVNDSQYITLEDVPKPDLSDYAKKAEIPDVSGFISEIPSEYITELELDSKGYLTEHQNLDNYAKKSDIPDVSKFITEVPAEYITEAELYAKGYLTQHQSLVGYATETFVANEIAKAKLEGEDVDLSGFATKDDIKNFITDIPSEYITESELMAKGYISDISHLATKASVPTKVSQLTNDSNFISSIPSEYVTESELTSKGYATESYVATATSSKATASDLVKAQKDILATQEALNKLISYGTSDPNANTASQFYFKYSTD